MSIAEGLIDFRTSDNSVITRKAAIAAINEALELAAQEADVQADEEPETDYVDVARSVAARIRALKSPAGPVQPEDASHARESDHAGL